MITAIDKVFDAIYQRQFDKVKELIAMDKNILKEKREETQETLLHYTIRNMASSSDVEIFNYILNEIKKFPAILNAMEMGQSNALHLAASRGYIDIVQPLLDAGIDYKVKCGGVTTAKEMFDEFAGGKFAEKYNELIAQFESARSRQAKTEEKTVTLINTSTTTTQHHSEPSTPTHYTERMEEKSSKEEEKEPLLSKSAPSLSGSILSQTDENESKQPQGQALLRRRNPTTTSSSPLYSTGKFDWQELQKQAEDLFAQKQFDKAAKSFLTIYQYHQQYHTVPTRNIVEICNSLGMCSDNTCDYKNAIDWFRKALGFDSTNQSALAHLKQSQKAMLQAHTSCVIQ